MKLAEKIMELRKANAMTQEELASICNVSRQSISKWEADIALPETEKILLLGNIFHVSMDVLLKDELTLGEVKEVHSCGTNAVQGKKKEIYEGVLIKESVNDENIIDFLNIHKIELWNTGGKPKYWTALFLPVISRICRNKWPKLWFRIRKVVKIGSLISKPEMRNISYSKIKY